MLKYLIIDRQYRIYQTDVVNGYLRNRARRGLVSIVDVKRGEGYNHDFTLSKIQRLPQGFRVDEENELDKWPIIEQVNNQQKTE